MLLVDNISKNDSSKSNKAHDEPKRIRDLKHGYHWEMDLSSSNQWLCSRTRDSLTERFALNKPTTLANHICRNNFSETFTLDLDMLIFDDIAKDIDCPDDLLSITSTIFYPEESIEHHHLVIRNNNESCFSEVGKIRQNAAVMMSIKSPRSASSVPIADLSSSSIQEDCSWKEDDSLCYSTNTSRSTCRSSSSSSTQIDSDDMSQRESTTEVVAKGIDSRDNELSQNIQVVVPTENDVLLGRGGKINNHPGNQRYLKARSQLHGKYERASKAEKRKVSDELIDIVHQWNGRFLKRIDDPCTLNTTLKIKKRKRCRDSTCVDRSEKWYEVTNEEARKKASQALREFYITPASRACKRKMH